MSVFHRIKRWRTERVLSQRRIPDALWAMTLARYTFLGAPGVERTNKLRDMTTLFLADKEFAGAQGLHVDDEMAVAIAAQACLPVLELGLDWYHGFKGIVVHADAVLAAREYVDEDGIVHRYDEELSGEAMLGGPVMLAWRDVEDAGQSAESAYNVVIHEFAHVLDMQDGSADGIPPLGSRSERLAWQSTLAREYEAFCLRVAAEHDTLLDPYAAEAPEEFFAVASEAFFVAPCDLHNEHPDFYRLLSGFYRQDPASIG